MSLTNLLWDLDQESKINLLVEKLEEQEKVIEELARRVLLLEEKNNKEWEYE